MITRIKMISKIYTFSFLTVIILISSGCNVQKRNSSDKKTFLLSIDPQKIAAIDMPQISHCIIIQSCKSAVPYSSKAFIYRTGQVAYETDSYNSYLVKPADQISQAVNEWITLSGLKICPTTGTSENHYILSCYLEEFYGNFLEGSKPQAVVKIRFSIYYEDVDKLSTKSLFLNSYESQVELENKSPDDLVIAQSQAVNNILLEFSKDLNQVLSDHESGKLTSK